MSNTATTVNTVLMIQAIRRKIAKLEKDFAKGCENQAFTINISYEGNRETDVERVAIGSISDSPEASTLFLELVLTSLRNSLSFYEKQAAHEIETLQKALTGE